MPPVCKFTKDQVLAAAVELTRQRGAQALTARALAQTLGCSVKPIFGLFQNMEQVRQGVMTQAEQRYQRYLQEDMAAGKYPAYKASGMAYIRFAREERELFKLLFMRDRAGEPIVEDRQAVRPMLALIQENLGLTEDAAYRFHLEMWVYVHGIATMVATGYLPWQEDFISQTVTDVYMGLRSRWQEEKHGGN